MGVDIPNIQNLSVSKVINYERVPVGLFHSEGFVWVYVESIVNNLGNHFSVVAKCLGVNRKAF